MKNLLQTTVLLEEFEEQQILYRAKKHWISFVIPVMLILVGSIGIVFTSFGMGIVKIIGFGLLYLLFKGTARIVKILNRKVYLTDKHVTISEGVFGKTVTDIPLNKLEGVHLSQNVLGKILDYGNLFVSTGGVNQSYVIRNPMELRSKIIN